MQEWAIERIIEERLARQSRSARPFSSFHRKSDAIWNVHRQVEKYKGKGKRDTIAEGRKQFIVSLITSLEVYFADIVCELLESENTDSGEIIQRLQEVKFSGKTAKYSLPRVLDIIDKKITKSELLREVINFQNLDEAFAVLKAIFNENLLEELKNNKFCFVYKDGQDNVKTCVIIQNIFYKHLKNLLSLRHSAVHSVSFKNTIPKKEVSRYYHLVTQLILCVDIKAESILNNRSVTIEPR
ncbi:MAG: HEPN domain-containing protein [Patescibacteria group bacterium UBA2103]